ncbi:MAG: Bug family tripartite tricarboxylate transporter substrate binding protein [Beijerinckiaceae bacterium]
MIEKRTGAWLSAALMAASTVLALPAAGQQAENPAFRAKEVSFYIPSAPGGGYDRYSRLVARHIGKHLPGKPVIVPKNMPGAGGLVLANYMYEHAPRDGSAIGGMQNERAIDPILKAPGAKFQASKLTWLGNANQITNVCVAWAPTGVTSAAQLRNREFVLGVVSGTSTESMANLLNELAGTKMKLVRGYKGTAEVMLAMERGEVEGLCGIGYDSYVSSNSDWINNKKANVFVQMGAERDPELPHTPFMHDLLVKKEDTALLDFLVGRMYMGRPFVAPPGLPPETVAILRTAFMATMKDPEFLGETKKAGVPINPVSGERVQAHVEKLERAPPEIVERARNLL